MKKSVFLAPFLVLSSVFAYSAPVTYNGITFPAGDVSFADSLIDLTLGSPAPTDPDFLDGTSALGPPDYDGTGAVSLGVGGNITVEFTDNSLTGSNSDDDDLHIFEIGPDVEDTDVWISMNGIDFISVGSVGGSVSSIDIDPYLSALSLDPFSQFSFVRLQDVASEGNTSGPTVGADIDAIGAISSAPPVTRNIPEPATFGIILLGLAGLGLILRRRENY
jgi:hypothetical protein